MTRLSYSSPPSGRIILTLFVTLAVGLILVAGPTPAAAQRGKRPQAMDFTAEGQVYGVKPGSIAIVTNEKEPWVVSLDDKTEVQVTGEAGPEVLIPGAFVRFTANLDGRRKGHDEVRELTLFSPHPGFQPTFEVEAGGDDENPTDEGSVDATSEDGDEAAGEGSGDEISDEDASEGAESDGSEKSAEDGEAGRKKPGADSRRKVITTRTFVSGVIRSIRKQEIYVQSTKGLPVRAQIALTAKVSVDTNLYGLARPGDQIDVSGSYYESDAPNAKARRPGRALAKSVTITLTNRTAAAAAGEDGAAGGFKFGKKGAEKD